MARKRKRLPEGDFPAHIDSLAHDGRGVARIDGKAVFIHGALPGEDVRFRYLKRSRRYDEGVAVAIGRAAPERVVPRCPHAGLCGGCSLQHMDPAAQIRAKQQVLLDNLQRIGNVQPASIAPPLTGPHWGYRRKARLGVKDVRRKGKVLVGFREKGTSRVADLSRCEVLHPAVGERMEALSRLVEDLSIRGAVPQIEVAIGDGVGALVFRVLEEPTAGDRLRLQAFGEATGLHIYLQPGGPDTVSLLWPAHSVLDYTLPGEGLRLRFLPTDFTQINADINRAMIAQALDWLSLEGSERVLDLFCGLGNFTLPLARHAREVVGVEGDAGLVQRARDNARHNGLDNAGFHVANLMDSVDGAPWLQDHYDRILLDPPRSGAEAMIPHLVRLKPPRILYVSCHPGSLARDAGLLAAQGYRLERAGVMDMFPHTAHVESMALFVRQPASRQ